MSKSGFVCVCGLPNVGKSTLLNKILGENIFITSRKPETTRNRQKAIYTDERGQIIFIDTPGMLSVKTKLEKYMLDEIKNAFIDIDAILLIEDVNFKINDNNKDIYFTNKEHNTLLELIKNINCKKILLLNKIDTLKNKDEVLSKINEFKNIQNFDEIIPISALNGDGIIDLIDTLFKFLKEGPMFYPEDDITDLPIKKIVADFIRKQMLIKLDKEIPHYVTVNIENMKEINNMYHIDAEIICDRDNHKGIIIGSKGSMIKEIGTKSRIEIEKFLSKKVNLKLFVKVKNNWYNNENLIKNYGYIKEWYY